ncbi:thioredoxin [Nocardia panacis]|uniref:Thioredoxin n=1 Tax=Nocardia panacis TaxID=2340916 RepID=A0A3A4KRL4_9NOCA|nr:thioredoxin family protein [Nocardia panacis]RJO78757.1 thioredoxin [Nocardia panacis]
MMEITIVAAVLLIAVAVGLLWQRRQGRVRPAAASDSAESEARAELLEAAGVTGSGPAVLHFSADWCGPCDAVRRVVANVIGEFTETPSAPRDIEVDIDVRPELAQALNVLSLPTTFIFDAEGRERFRISGVPKAGDLRTALAPLTIDKAA